RLPSTPGEAPEFMNHAQHAHHAHGTRTAPAGGKTVDPVCGMQVDPATATESADYKGAIYYFCCDGCREMFQADPAKYLAQQPAPPVAAFAAAPAGAQYTCPMHPEILQDGPGSCPKCGMALVPVLPALPMAQEYTCPMHPEVRSPRAGSCPKC